MEKIVSWAKRRGFIFPSSEIYGGVAGVYDFGPRGVELINNLKQLWWKRFVTDRDDVVGIDSAILMSRRVWQASGHEKGFSDPLVECKKCHARFRQDRIENPKSKIQPVSPQARRGGNPKQIQNSKSQIQNKCPECGGELTEAKQFNLMLKTYLGPVEEEKNLTYLRPETAQGMFVNFKNVLDTSRQKLPFGIAQIGKSFRNEITTGEYLFRVREFEIAEIEYFVQPGNDEKWFDYWLGEWKKFLLDLDISEKNLIEYQHSKKDLSHYSKRTVDYNFRFPFGEKELTGVANRTDFDLKNHEEFSGQDLKYFDEASGKKYWPYVIEPTLGIGRLALAAICDAFEEISGGRSGAEGAGEEEVVMHFAPKIAPVKVAVLPLVKKLSEPAKKIYLDLKKCYVSEFDESGTIGRRYRRQDEIGTPYCITFDFDSLKDKKVTVRDRDSMKQDRVEIDKLSQFLWGKLGK